MYAPRLRFSVHAGSPISPSPIKRTLSETVEYLRETAHPPTFAGKTGDMEEEYETRIGQHIAAINDLKGRLLQAENTLEGTQREVKRLHATHGEDLKAIEGLEAAVREKSESIELLEHDERDRIQRYRETETQHKRELTELVMERDQLLVSRDDLRTKLDGFSRTNHGLVKKVIEQKKAIEQTANSRQRANDHTASTLSASPTYESTRNFAPPSSLPSQDPEEEAEKNVVRVKAQAQMIKDFQAGALGFVIKESEWESERIRLETKVADLDIVVARLTEENETYQVMLNRKTLNGELLDAEFLQASESIEMGKGLGSLAEELEAASDEDDEAETSSFVEKDEKTSQLQATNKRQAQTIRDLAVEIKDLQQMKKAHTQYIGNILTRILQFGDLTDVLNGSDEEFAKAAEARKAKLNMQKELPAPPSGRSSMDSDRAPALTEGGLSGMIRRGFTGVRRSRPSSTVFTPSPNQPPWESVPTRNDQISPLPTPHLPNQNESPYTAMSIPLPQGRGHRRTQSEKSNDPPVPNAPAPAALVVNNMYRPSPTGPSSPASPGGTANRTSYFSPPSISRAISGVSTDNKAPLLTPRSVSTASAAPSQSMQAPPSHDSSRNPSGTFASSTTAIDSLDGDDARSVVMGPPRNAAGMTQYTSAVTTQKGMRPLRIVQEKNDVDAAKKKANRQSWFGWASKG